MSVRLLLLVSLLLPSSARADTEGYKLLEEALQPPAALAHVTGPRLDRRSRESRSWRNQSSARKLQGVVCVEHIFAADSTSSWTEAHRQSVREQTDQALRHLRSKAGELGVALTWREKESLYMSAEEISVSNHDHLWTRDAVLDSWEKLGLYWPRASCPARECEQRLAILHVPKPGRSYALPSIISPDYELERIVMFMRQITIAPREVTEEQASILVPERPSSFVHEILHLFGAQDLYEPEARLQAATRRYPREIMLHSNAQLENLEISEYTAYYIGWSDREPPALPLDE